MKNPMIHSVHWRSLPVPFTQDEWAMPHWLHPKHRCPSNEGGRGCFVKNFRLPKVLVWSGLSSSHPFRNRKLYAVYWYLIIYKHSNFVYRTTSWQQKHLHLFFGCFFECWDSQGSRREGSREENETWLPGDFSYGDLYMFVKPRWFNDRDGESKWPFGTVNNWPPIIWGSTGHEWNHLAYLICTWQKS